MSDIETIEAVDGGEEPPLYIPATREDFAASGLTEFLAERLSADCYALEDAFREASIKAKASGEVARERVFGLLAGLMSCHLRMDDPAEVFGPKLVLGDRRSMIPSDVRGEQTAVIADVTPTVAHPLVRARLGDVAFLNDRRHHAAGRAAMGAYCAVADGIRDGTVIAGIPGIELGMHDVVKPISRAIDLMRLLSKKGFIDDTVREAFGRAWDQARDGAHYFALAELADAGMPVGLVRPDDVARDAERLAAAVPADTYPEAVKRVWLLAARCHGWAGRKDDEDRCRLEAAEQTLKMRNQCGGALAKADWTKQAIGELREIKGTKDRVRELLDEMRQLQF